MSPKPHCDDQALLLLVHGELPLWGRWRTLWHLQHCARCRKRFGHYAQAATALSAALHHAGTYRRFPSLPSSPWVALGLIGLIVGAGATLRWQWVRAEPVVAAPAHHSTNLASLSSSDCARCHPAGDPQKGVHHASFTSLRSSSLPTPRGQRPRKSAAHRSRE